MTGGKVFILDSQKPQFTPADKTTSEHHGVQVSKAANQFDWQQNEPMAFASGI